MIPLLTALLTELVELWNLLGQCTHLVECTTSLNWHRTIVGLTGLPYIIEVIADVLNFLISEVVHQAESLAADRAGNSTIMVIHDADVTGIRVLVTAHLSENLILSQLQGPGLVLSLQLGNLFLAQHLVHNHLLWSSTCETVSIIIIVRHHNSFPPYSL